MGGDANEQAYVGSDEQDGPKEAHHKLTNSSKKLHTRSVDFSPGRKRDPTIGDSRAVMSEKPTHSSYSNRRKEKVNIKKNVRISRSIKEDIPEREREIKMMWGPTTTTPQARLSRSSCCPDPQSRRATP